jgi:hypothetical protein
MVWIFGKRDKATEQAEPQTTPEAMTRITEEFIAQHDEILAAVQKAEAALIYSKRPRYQAGYTYQEREHEVKRQMDQELYAKTKKESAEVGQKFLNAIWEIGRVPVKSEPPLVNSFFAVMLTPAFSKSQPETQSIILMAAAQLVAARPVDQHQKIRESLPGASHAVFDSVVVEAQKLITREAEQNIKSRVEGFSQLNIAARFLGHLDAGHQDKAEKMLEGFSDAQKITALNDAFCYALSDQINPVDRIVLVKKVLELGAKPEGLSEKEKFEAVRFTSRHMNDHLSEFVFPLIRVDLGSVLADWDSKDYYSNQERSRRYLREFKNYRQKGGGKETLEATVLRQAQELSELRDKFAKLVAVETAAAPQSPAKAGVTATAPSVSGAHH